MDRTISSFRMRFKVVSAAFAAAFAAESAPALDVFDDAAFKLDLRGDLNGNAFIDPGEVGNAYDFSAAQPMQGVYGSAGFLINAQPGYDQAQWGILPQQETAAVQNPYNPYYTDEKTVLDFPQSSKVEGGTTYWAQQGLTFQGGAVHGNDGVRTIYVRCRWDGNTSGPNMLVCNGFNAGGTAGQSLCLTGGGEIAMMTDNSQVNSGLYVTRGQWCDIFAETENRNVDGAVKAVTTFTLCKPSANGADYNPPVLEKSTLANSTAMSIPEGRSLTIGCYYHNAYWNGNAVYTAGANPRSFRGLVADVMIWKRALSDAEKIAVMAGQRGAKFVVGAANGSAEEFNDGSNAAVAAAEVFEPRAMPWHLMRGTLDAARPSLAIRVPLGGYEAGKPMILSVTPILSGTGASVPVAVSVNGVPAGSFDLARQRNFTIKDRFWTRGQDGCATIELARTTTAGTVLIDAISLSGSWQNTADDGGGNGMLDQKYAPAMAFAGDTSPTHFPASISVGNNTTNWTFGVYVPQGMGERYGWIFRTRATNRDNTSGLAESHAVLVNGAVAGTHSGTFEPGEYFEVPIPAGTLVDGMNFVQFVQTAPSRTDPGYSGGVWQSYDFWGMDLVPPPESFVMVVR